jgi:hypothetical protein
MLSGYLYYRSTLSPEQQHCRYFGAEGELNDGQESLHPNQFQHEYFPLSAVELFSLPQLLK